MAVSSVDAKETPEAQLRSLIENSIRRTRS